MEVIDGISISEEQTILSLAKFSEENKGLDDNQLINELSQKSETGQIEIYGSRGLHFWQDLLNKLRNREVVQELGEYDVEIPFLSFHVPQGGTGHLKIKNTRETDDGFKLSFLGLGFGQGKKISFTLDTDFGERKKCFHLVNKLRVKVTEIQTVFGRKRKYLQSDVLKIIENGISVSENCPLCSEQTAATGAAIDPFFMPINLKKDSTGISQQHTLKLAEEKEFEFGFTVSLASINMAPKVSIKRSVQSECNINYSFPAGFSYYPYRNNIYQFNDLPYWRRE